VLIVTRAADQKQQLIAFLISLGARSSGAEKDKIDEILATVWDSVHYADCLTTTNPEKVGDEDQPPIQAAVRSSTAEPVAKTQVTGYEMAVANSPV
jgi:hypothetical protein